MPAIATGRQLLWASVSESGNRARSSTNRSNEQLNLWAVEKAYTLTEGLVNGTGNNESGNNNEIYEAILWTTQQTQSVLKIY